MKILILNFSASLAARPPVWPASAAQMNRSIIAYHSTLNNKGPVHYTENRRSTTGEEEEEGEKKTMMKAMLIAKSVDHNLWIHVCKYKKHVERKWECEEGWMKVYPYSYRLVWTHREGAISIMTIFW